MKDTIYREAAIDALTENMPSTYTPDGSHPADDGIFMVQEVYADCIQMLKELPSAQPEIIRCKDCKYGVHAGCGNTYLCVVSPENRLEHKYDFWCAYAERRRDEQTD